MSIKAVIRRNIKSRARDMLRGSWGTAILIFVLVILVTLGFNMLQMGLQSAFAFPSVEETINNSVIDNIYDLYNLFLTLMPSYILSLVIGILIFFVMSPINFGVTDWFMQLMSGTKHEVSYVFNWLGDGRKYVRSLGATFLVNLKSFLWMLPFMAVSLAGSMAFTVLLIGGAERMLGLYIVVFFLLMLFLIAGGVLMAIFLQRYLLVPYLSIRFPEMRLREVFRRSVTMMKGHKGESFVFVLSFIGWYLLLLPTCGFIMLYVYPYVTASLALFAFYVMDSHAAQERGEGEKTVENGSDGAPPVYELPTQMPAPQEGPQDSKPTARMELPETEPPAEGGEQPPQDQDDTQNQE